MAALVLSTVALLSVAVSSDASNHRPIPDGDWLGVITFFGDAATARGDFEGSFRLGVAGGTASGDFDWQGIVATDAVGDVSVSIGGEISGDASAPEFTITSAVSGGAVVSNADGGGNIRLTNVTCESIEGTGENITTAAQISDIQWLAIRSSAPLAGGTFFDDLTDLRLEAITLVGDLGSRPVAVVAAEINRLVGEAEVLLLALDRTPECQAFFFRTLIASQVGELLEAVLNDPRLAEAAEFGQVVLISLRAGVWGPGAGDPDAIDIEVAVIEEFERRVDEAIADDDGAALLSYGWLAVALGFDSIADRITDVIGGSP